METLTHVRRTPLCRTGSFLGGVVSTDRRGGQRSGIHRDIVDAAGEVLTGWEAGPAGEVVATHPPQARVALGRGGCGIGCHVGAIHVQLHAGSRRGCGDVVPAAVVVGPRRCDGLGGGRVDAEDQGSSVRHVDVLVVRTGQSGLRIAVSHDLAAPGRRGLEPRFHSECVGAGGSGGRGGTYQLGGAVEGGGPAGITGCGGVR